MSSILDENHENDLLLYHHDDDPPPPPHRRPQPPEQVLSTLTAANAQRVERLEELFRRSFSPFSSCIAPRPNHPRKRLRRHSDPSLLASSRPTNGSNEQGRDVMNRCLAMEIDLLARGEWETASNDMLPQLLPSSFYDHHHHHDRDDNEAFSPQLLESLEQLQQQNRTVAELIDREHAKLQRLQHIRAELRQTHDDWMYLWQQQRQPPPNQEEERSTTMVSPPPPLRHPIMEQSLQEEHDQLVSDLQYLAQCLEYNHSWYEPDQSDHEEEGPRDDDNKDNGDTPVPTNTTTATTTTTTTTTTAAPGPNRPGHGSNTAVATRNGPPPPPPSWTTAETGRDDIGSSTTTTTTHTTWWSLDRLIWVLVNRRLLVTRDVEDHATLNVRRYPIRKRHVQWLVDHYIVETVDRNDHLIRLAFIRDDDDTS